VRVESPTVRTSVGVGETGLAKAGDAVSVGPATFSTAVETGEGAEARQELAPNKQSIARMPRVAILTGLILPGICFMASE
jgi:hypothetical protein